VSQEHLLGSLPAPAQYLDSLWGLFSGWHTLTIISSRDYDVNLSGPSYASFYERGYIYKCPSYSSTPDSNKMKLTSVIFSTGLCCPGCGSRNLSRFSYVRLDQGTKFSENELVQQYLNWLDPRGKPEDPEHRVVDLFLRNAKEKVAYLDKIESGEIVTKARKTRVLDEATRPNLRCRACLLEWKSKNPGCPFCGSKKVVPIQYGRMLPNSGFRANLKEYGQSIDELYASWFAGKTVKRNGHEFRWGGSTSGSFDWHCKACSVAW